MSADTDFIQDETDNTYGIEVEFGTHDNQALSFTHIEVCYLYPQGEAKERGWKIETDADYTLELVSPILKFRDKTTAAKFQEDLMAFLEKEVRTGILLGQLMIDLDNFIKRLFTFANGIWTYAPSMNALALTISWITSKELVDDLTWVNWDEDTDLERVLAARRITTAELARNAGTSNAATAARMQDVIVTKSRKHGGLPSSQLNLPMRLWVFAHYESYFKRDKAWARLLEENTSKPGYIDKKIAAVKKAYPDLVKNKVWASKYLNSDYVESQIDEKTRFWHRYWLWLETFFICGGHLSKDAGWNNMAGISAYIEEVNNIVEAPGYPVLSEAQAKLKALKILTTKAFDADYALDSSADLLYLTVHKLVAGALSEMSETLQMQAQQKLMSLDGDMTMDQIMESIPNNQFTQFHYALKDLTSLWFKAPLLDVFDAENAVVDRRAEVAKAKQRITTAPPGFLAEMITRVLHANLKLLGWYYSVCAANNQGFEYEWEEFISYNMPSIPTFSQSLQNSADNLAQRLNGQLPQMLSTNAELPQDDVVFLKRRYTRDEVLYLNVQNIPIGYVAPWEGRWDTMKPVIVVNSLPRYLVEHRNN
jgi:hypothetical protein